MRTLVCTQPGNFEYRTVAGPVLIPGHTIIKIKRIGICGTDLHAFEGTQPYFEYPRILGHELAGEIVETNGAPGFAQGEAVTIIPYLNCGTCVSCRSNKPNCCVNLKVCGVHIDGGMAEYLSVPSYSLVQSNGLSFDELALVEPLAIGAHGIGRAAIKKGEFAVVIGAGPIGIGAMELARIAGARVIAIDVNESRLQFCHERVKVEFLINGLSANVTEQLKDITGGDLPTVVIDATGNLGAINNAFQYMAHGGRYVLIGLQKGNITFSHPEFHKREATLMSSRNATRADFETVMNILKTGLIDPFTYITHRIKFDHVKNEFPNLVNPASGVIKAIVDI